MNREKLHSLVDHCVDNLILFNCFEVLKLLMVKMCWLMVLDLISGEVLVKRGAVLF